MSKATKVVLGTIVAALVLSTLIVANLALV